MAYVSKLEADERADLIAAQQHAAALKAIVERRRELAAPELAEDLKWAEGCAHDILGDLNGILANTEPMSFR